MSERASWARPQTDAEQEQERAVLRRRRWIRPQTVYAVLGVVLVDIVVLFATGAVQGVIRAHEGRPCKTFWIDRSHDAVTGIWTTTIVLLLILACFAWRRWLFVAAVVVQIAAAAILIPPQFHDRDLYADVAHGKVPLTQVDSGGFACDQ